MDYTPLPSPRGRLIQRDAWCFPRKLPPNPAAGPAGTEREGQRAWRGVSWGMTDPLGIKVPWGCCLAAMGSLMA